MRQRSFPRFDAVTVRSAQAARGGDRWSSLLLEPLWRLLPVALLLLLMWLATAVNLLLLRGAWLPLGVRAHDPAGFWPNLLIAPLLHAGLGHLLANSVPFAVLGGLIALRSPWRFGLVTLAGAVIGAAVVWLLGAPNSVHIGASGLVFTYFGWLIARAIRERSILAIILGLLTLALYGGVLWGLSPFQVGISWQGHLGGLLGGLAAAFAWPRLLGAKDRARPTGAAITAR